jgi:hypothetical protein
MKEHILFIFSSFMEIIPKKIAYGVEFVFYITNIISLGET